jgi:hypothetical protein
MQTTQTSGDILIQVVIFFGGSLVLFLLTRYVFPWLGDWWARRSIRRRAIRVAELTEALDEYEKDFADIKRSIARLLLKGLSAIVCMLYAILMLLLSVSFLTSTSLFCMIENTCQDSLAQHHALVRGAVFMMFSFLCLGVFFSNLMPFVPKVSRSVIASGLENGLPAFVTSRCHPKGAQPIPDTAEREGVETAKKFKAISKLPVIAL